MNTEQAIKLFSGILENKGQIKNLRYINPKHIECAIEALREKAEREKGCAFCNTGAHRILQNALYCPRCGKRLEVNNG